MPFWIFDTGRYPQRTSGSISGSSNAVISRAIWRGRNRLDAQALQVSSACGQLQAFYLLGPDARRFVEVLAPVLCFPCAPSVHGQASPLLPLFASVSELTHQRQTPRAA